MKRLEIQGFKSFVEKIGLEFDQGITAVVGPNGSGKSNISDAIRWVMGEQSVKSLRGSKMEDVIFAGTQSLSPLGFAEASMTLDNSGGLFPLEYHEITITRRIFRSGESEYFINKTPCRLRDIHELFMDTGLGRDGYSVIGQGRIDEILSAKSEDRRQIFEEAAGISKYKYRKNEAERKLSHTNENLTRLKDIISELESQLAPLKGQSEKARRYLDLREELKALDVNAALCLIDERKQSIQTQSAGHAIVSEQLQSARAEIEAYDSKAQLILDAIKESDTRIDETRERLHSIEVEDSRIQSRIELAKNDIKNTNQNISRVRYEIEDLHSKIRMNQQETAERQSRRALLSDKAGAIEDELGKLEARSQEIIGRVGEQSAVIERTRAEAESFARRIEGERAKEQGIHLLQSTFHERLEALEESIKNITAESESITDKLDTLSEQKNSWIERETAAKQTGQALLALKAGLAADIESLKSSYNSASARHNEKNARRTLLVELERDMEGYQKGVKIVLEQTKTGALTHVGAHGVLARLVRVDESLVTAVETALGAAAQNIVVDNEEDARACIEHLKSVHGGRVTFLPLSSVNGRTLDNISAVSREQGFVGLASDLLEYDVKYSDIIQNILGRTVVVDNIDNGIAISRRFSYRFRIVTMDGQTLNVGGSITGGSAARSAGLLSRGKEIAALTKECADLQKDMDKLDDDIADKIEEQAANKSALEQARNALEQAQNEGRRISGEQEINRRLLQSATENRAGLEDERTSLVSRVDNAHKEKEDIKDNIGGIEAEMSDLQARLEQDQQLFRDMISERDEIARQSTQKRMEHSSVQKDVEMCDQQLERLGQDLAAMEQQAASKDRQAEEMNDQIKNQERMIERDASLLVQNQRLAEEIKLAAADIIAQKTDMDQRAAGLRVRSRELVETSFKLQEEAARIESRMTKAELELENAVSRLWDEYELSYTTALPYRAPGLDMKKAARRITELRGAIKALGNINIDAIEEYKQVDERYQFLSAQEADLNRAKAQLAGIIAEMTEVMKTSFQEQFEIITKNFNTVFTELFGGGHADLRLSDPDNILESGIEIDVQPPGKRLQSLMLLSGGERAFTAIALLFAILKVRPAPFCVLDEIEAALDDANVYRFAAYLKKHSKSTQFVMVTHRRGTMEAANILYGVTMQDKGVSKLLRLTLDDCDNIITKNEPPAKAEK